MQNLRVHPQRREWSLPLNYILKGFMALSHVQTLCSPMDCSPSGSSCPWHFWGSSFHRDRTLLSWVSCIGKWILYHWAMWGQICWVLRNAASLVCSTGMGERNGSVRVRSGRLYRPHYCILDKFFSKILKRWREDSRIGSQMCTDGYYFGVGFSRQVGKKGLASWKTWGGCNWWWKGRERQEGLFQGQVSGEGWSGLHQRLLQDWGGAPFLI